jgi:hypothetical protein
VRHLVGPAMADDDRLNGRYVDIPQVVCATEGY